MAIIPQETPQPTGEPLQSIIGNVIVQNWFLIFLLISAISLTICIFYLVKILKSSSRKESVKAFKDFNISKLKVKMFRSIAGIPHEIDTKDIDINKGKFRYNNKDFSLIDIKKVMYSDNDAKYYGFDYDSGLQISFHKPATSTKIKESLDLIDTWINRNVIQQLTAGLENIGGMGGKSVIIAIIVSLTIGLVAGTLVGYFGHGNTVVVQPQPTPFINNIMEKLIC